MQELLISSIISCFLETWKSSTVFTHFFLCFPQTPLINASAVLMKFLFCNGLKPFPRIFIVTSMGLSILIQNFWNFSFGDSLFCIEIVPKNSHPGGSSWRAPLCSCYAHLLLFGQCKAGTQQNSLFCGNSFV